MTTSENSQPPSLLPMELPLTSSVAASRAKTLVSQARALASLAKGRDYGATTLGSLASYDHNLSSWKTSQHCLVEGLETFSETWPRSGMMRNGRLYLRRELVLPTIAIGSGLWPTPAARDGKDLSRSSAFLSAKLRHQPSMATRLLTLGAHWTVVSQVYDLAMGFPLFWSAASSERLATRLSLKSPNS